MSSPLPITPAFAETTAHYNTPITELSTKQADLSFAFDDVENLQAVAMTDREMVETQGAVAPLVAVGVIHGGHFVAQR